MIFKSAAPRLFFPTLALLFVSYQQLSAAQAASSANLSFCLNQPTTSSTMRSFWHDASSSCELEPKRLIDLYSQLNEKIVDASDNRCSLLLIHQIRKKLIDTVSQALEEALIIHSSLRDNRELNRLLEEIHATDKRISEAVWQRALDEIHLFVEKEVLIQEILQLKSEEIQVFGLKALLNKSRESVQENRRILPLLTYALTKLLRSKSLPPTSRDKLNIFYHQMPQELRLLYSQLGKMSSVGLLNSAHWEYLYAPRDNGPDSERRTPLTWSKEKNSTDSDGHFRVEINSAGLLAFASLFGSSPKFLYTDVENQAPYFWIGKGTKASLQWWQIIWTHESNAMESLGEDRPVAFQSNTTGEYLCAASPYDENRRYVILMSDPESAHRADCLWLVKQI